MLTSLTLVAPSVCRRLDLFLLEHLTQRGFQHSRQFWQQLIETGHVTSPITPNLKRSMKVHQNDIFYIRIPTAQPLALRPTNQPLDIIYTDDDVIIVNKPAGMVTHPAQGHWEEGTLVHALLYHFKDSLSGVNGWQRPGILHRLDKETSGLILIAKHDQAHKYLSDQFQDRSLSRTYWGLVWGEPAPPIRWIDLPIGRDVYHSLRQAVRGRSAREAQTLYHVNESLSQSSAVTFQLKTGRTHQIRVHMAHIRHPLIGDKLYGSGKNPWQLKIINQYLPHRHALHAQRLTFIHPTSLQKLTFEAPIPPELNVLHKALQKSISSDLNVC